MADFENSKSKLRSLQSTALDLWKADKKSAKELGEALTEVRKAMRAVKYGTFGAWLKENGIPQNRASYCMRVFRGEKDKPKKSKPKAAKRAYALTTEVNLGVVSLARARKTKPAKLVNEILAEYLKAHAVEVGQGQTLAEPTQALVPSFKLAEPLKPGSIAVKTATLKRALKTVGVVIDEKSSANVRLFTDAGAIKLAAYERKATLTAILGEAKADGNVDLTLPFQKFQKLIDMWPSDATTIIEPKEGGVIVKNGRTSGRLESLEKQPWFEGNRMDRPTDFVAELDLLSFQSQIEDVEYAMGEVATGNRSRPDFNMLILESDGSTLRVLASDGARIAYSSMNWTGSKFEKPLIIPEHAVSRILRLSGSNVKLGTTQPKKQNANARDYHNWFITDTEELSVRNIWGSNYKLPDYDRTIQHCLPDDKLTTAIAIDDTADFLTALETLTIASEEPQVQLKMKKNGSTLQLCSAKEGVIDDPISVRASSNGQAVSLILNGTRLLDFVRRAAARPITMNVMDASLLVDFRIGKSIRYLQQRRDILAKTKEQAKAAAAD
jgi:DNA polymerase III sliding clamp (beta) subunit (PCNA family)